MKKIVLLLVALRFSGLLLSQSIGIGTTTPNASAALDIQSNTKGLLPPRMNSAKVNAISNPSEGLVVFDTDIKALRMFNGSRWVTLSESNDAITDAPGHFYGLPPSPANTATIYMKAVAIGPNKSVYIGGQILSGSFTLGNITITNSNSVYDIFFAKLDSLGNVQWLNMLTGNTTLDQLTDLEVDAAGNVYICGSFTSTLDFDPGPGVQNMTVESSTAGFYAKYNSNGAWQWSKRFGGSNSTVNALITDGTSLYVTGSFAGTVTFNPTSFTTLGSNDIFLCRYQCSDGNMAATGWARRMGGSNSDIGTCLAFKNGNLLAGGSFNGSCSFGGIVRTSAGDDDGYFVMYSTGGTVSDAYSIGGTGEDIIQDVAADAAGNIYCVGHYSGVADFDPSASSNVRTSAGGTDGFMVRYNTTLTTMYLAECKGTANDVFTKAHINEAGELYILGQVSGAARVGVFDLDAYANDTDANIIFGKWPGPTGFEWLQQAGSNSADIAGDFALVPGTANAVIVAGIIGNPHLKFDQKKQAGNFYLAWYYE